MYSRFDAIASVYDAEIPGHLRGHYLQRKVDLIVARLGAFDPATAVGLDLGCGTGWHVKRLRDLGFAHVYGLDNSVAQMAEAKRNAVASGAAWCLADVLRLPYAAGSVDFAFAINVIHHLETVAEQGGALTEIGRILKPGGTFFLHEINTINPVIGFYMDYVFPRRKHIDNGLERWLAPESLARLPGFELVDVEYFTFVPDFTPRFVFPLLRWLEERLEATSLRRYGAHFMATLRKM